MNPVAETLLANRFPGQDTLPACGLLSGWRWAGTRRIGSRHLASGGVCEDALQAGVVGQRLQLMLADGVSGGACGEVAATALATYGAACPADVASWMDQADSVVREALAERTSAPGAATFAGAWLSESGTALMTRVGDCRVYVFEQDESRARYRLAPALRDQTLAYMGYVAPNHPRALCPAHMVGNGNMGRLEWVRANVPPKGGVLLCSDGLHAVVSDNMLNDWLVEVLHPAGHQSIDPAQWSQFCERLIDEAQAQGSDDDVALLLAVRL